MFRGEGGEIERRPNKPTQVMMTSGNAEPVMETWAPLLPDPHQPPDQDMDPANLAKLWRGEADDAYALASVTGTIAIALRAMGAAQSVAEAEQRAAQVWEARNRDFLPFNP